MRKYNHWSPRYFWNRSVLYVDQKMCPADPWFTRQAITLLQGLLRERDDGIEWGSGRSTAWFAGRVGHLWSIESDPIWFARVEADLRSKNLLNVSYVLQTVESKDESNSNHRYVSVIDQIPDQTLDFGLVDGKIRDACAVRLVRKLRPGGILIIDNIERYLPSASKSPEALGLHRAPATELWSEYAQIVSTWRRIWTTNGVVDTCIWFKPCE